MNGHHWTQRMELHLNGGSDFSQLNYRVQCDGQKTDIVRVTRTTGSPKYLKTIDELHCGSDVFDILATKGQGMKDWLEAHCRL